MSMRGMRSRESSDKCVGSEYSPPLIFLNRFAILSSSNGCGGKRYEGGGEEEDKEGEVRIIARSGAVF